MIKWPIGENFHHNYQFMMKYNEEKTFKSECDINECLRILLLEEGTLILNINKKVHALNAPSIICINNKDIAFSRSQISYKIKSIYFHPRVVNNFLNMKNIYEDELSLECGDTVYQDRNLLLPFVDRSDNYNGYINIGINYLYKCQDLFKKIKEETEVQGDKYWPCRSRACFLELLIMLQKLHLDNISEDYEIKYKNSNYNLEKVLEYIHTNYSNKITISELVEKFNINRTTLNQQFSQLTGSSTISYLIKHRVRIANNLLKDTSLPVSEISIKVGFEDISNFNKSFKKFYGMTPTNFRKKFGD